LIDDYGAQILVAPKFIASVDKYKNIIIRYKAKY